MQDIEIVKLFWERDEQAIQQTKIKYGQYLKVIARNILDNLQDSEEVVSETYMRAWNAMPDDRPTFLASYLSKITRRLSIDRYRKYKAKKRGSGVYEQALDELTDISSNVANPQDLLDAKELAKQISHFLREQPANHRNIFISRYYFMDCMQTIAKNAGMKEGTVRSILSRQRKALREYLIKEGYLL